MKAVALLSGGLDSTLAIKVVQEQGIEITGLNFKSPFCRCDGNSGCRKKALVVSEQLGIETKVRGFGNEYLVMVANPRHGYGKNLNPCIDCRILMFSKAKEFMRESGASFIITGEVVGQRPMSQNRQSMSIIDRESGLEGLVLRPLSAGLMEPTIPETKGWVDRKKLLSVQGRSRKEQLSLVERFQLTGYGCPAGGCLLTDKNLTERFRDLIKADMFDAGTIRLVMSGRYTNLAPDFKLVVGRDEAGNRALELGVRDGDILMIPEVKGPTAVGRGNCDDGKLAEAVRVVSSYCKVETGFEIYKISGKPGNLKREKVTALSPSVPLSKK